MQTLGKIKATGETYWYSSPEKGNDMMVGNGTAPIHLITIGLGGQQYDWWTTGGTVYFGKWSKPHWLRNPVELIGEDYSPEAREARS